MTSKFNNLPTDILRSLLLYFEYKQLYVFFRISKKFGQLFKDNIFWTSYANSRGIPSTAYQSIVLNHLGYYDKPNIQDKNILWNTKLSPLTFGAICTFEYESRRTHPLSKEQLRKIFFKTDVFLEIAFRDRPEKLSTKYIMRYWDKRERKRFLLKTNTCVGSTLEHVFAEIYRNMYNLNDSELTKDLSIETPNFGYADALSYDNIGKLYVLSINYDRFFRD
jgi:hypothetical protein